MRRAGRTGVTLLDAGRAGRGKLTATFTLTISSRTAQIRKRENAPKTAQREPMPMSTKSFLRSVTVTSARDISPQAFSKCPIYARAPLTDAAALWRPDCRASPASNSFRCFGITSATVMRLARASSSASACRTRAMVSFTRSTPCRAAAICLAAYSQAVSSQSSQPPRV